MKKSKSIRLVLIGSLSAGAMNGCSPSSTPSASLVTRGVYTNDYHIPGLRYYHAPFRDWYSLPYNHYDPARRMYFHGGQWSEGPHQSITNISSPSDQAFALAQSSSRPNVHRSGFGNTGYRRSTWS